METSLRGAETAAAWQDWETHNVAIDDDGVRIAAQALPTYGQGRPATVDAVTVADVALAPCGDPYLLTDEGALYRYDPARDTAEELSCVWRATGDPTALCVTSDTIYVAGTDPGAVQAISRYALQTRWLREAGVHAPIALCRSAGEAYLLDGASPRGAASIKRIDRDERLEPVVEGLMAPLDLASDAEGRLWALDELVGTDPGGDHVPVVRRFDRDVIASGDPVAATDTIHLAPEAFRIHGTGTPVVPTCLAVGAGGDLLVGVHHETPGQPALLRYRSDDAAFERQPAVEAPARALAAPGRADDPQAYVVDHDGHLHVVDGDYRTRRDRDGRRAGRLVNRFEASEEGVQWHRVHVARTLAGSEDEVRVRYATTDAHQPEPQAGDWDAPELAVLSGLGETYAERLRQWGVEDLADLADRSAAAVQSMVSVEEVDVSESTVREWQAQAEDLLAAGEPANTAVTAVDGIGPTYAARLEAGSVPDLETLSTTDAAAIARIVSAGTLDVSLSRTTEWVQAARDQRPERATPEDLDWTTITPSSPSDALLTDAVGRYCWIEIELLGTATSSPRVSACQVEFPRDTYLSELPAIYNAESRAFLERYLSLFERVFTDVEADIEDLTTYLDPDGIPAEAGHLSWLGSFLGMDVEETWPTPVAREFVDRASELYRVRGTRRGLRMALDVYLEHVQPETRDWTAARAQEDARLDQLVETGLLTAAEADRARESHEALAAREPADTVSMRAWSGLECADDGPAREFYERLLGCEEGFLVLLHPRVAEEDVRNLALIVAAQEPAHASVRTVGLERGVQLSGTCEEGTAERGYHTYLGVNTTLVERSFALDEAGLGEETVLGSHEPDGQLDLSARLGADTHLS
jgi:phage tail-like protein